jgi:hypothetical protein
VDKKLYLTEFQQIFEGNKQNYGQHKYKFTSKKGEKEAGESYTIKEKLLTQTQYKAHLDGKIGLGVIPINKKNQCKFAVIDIDIYSKNLSTYLEAIEKHNFPLVPFRSKSGGLHLYLFLSKYADVKNVRIYLEKMAILLGLDLLIQKQLNRVLEIFPKQTKLAADNIGTWINLPYFNADNTQQYAIKNGKKLSLGDALTYIKSKIISIYDIKAFLDNIPFFDGPPCLQTIYLLNPLRKNSGRNNYLFSFGVYFKKQDEHFFEQKVLVINNELEAPLDENELEKTVLSSLRKKDYIYKCFDSPCVDFCNRTICKTRKFGIGKMGGYFSNIEFGKLYQIQTELPYYEWEVKAQSNSGAFKRLSFRNEDEIIKQDVFLRLCFRELHTLPVKMKQVEWFKLVNQHLEEIEIIHVNKEDDISPYSIFRNYFIDFLTNRAMANNKDQILNKRVYFDKPYQEYYFRSFDLVEFFHQKNFRDFSTTEIHRELTRVGAKPKKIKTETRQQIRVWCLGLKDFKLMTTAEQKEFVANFDPEKEF